MAAHINHVYQMGHSTETDTHHYALTPDMLSRTTDLTLRAFLNVSVEWHRILGITHAPIPPTTGLPRTRASLQFSAIIEISVKPSPAATARRPDSMIAKKADLPSQRKHTLEPQPTIGYPNTQ
ncbi:hypothetical protein FQN50_001089 [Emmonsiellopsis sp. PD_5]|nr:hypothetical protein FQN50_001089 [Emmonsiellopsis sp. PD_5]